MGMDFPNWAETKFENLCHEVGLTPTKSTIDRFGWDYIVEFQKPTQVSVPLDQRRGVATARVQIKSKTGGKAETRLKLSNAMVFAKEPNPCFVVLVWKSKDGSETKYYARHFDRELIAEALKKARQADHDGRADLNRMHIYVKFKAGDELRENLIEWIQTEVVSGGESYGSEKQKLGETLGFDKQILTGKIKFRQDELTTLIDHAIGLKPDFQAEHIDLRNTRFDIPAGTPLFSGKPDKMHLRVNPEPAKLTISGQNGYSAQFDGEFRTFSLPGLEAAKSSFLCPFITSEITLQGKFSISYHYKSDSVVSLRELYNIVSFHLASRSDLSIALEVSQLPILTIGTLKLKADGEDEFDWFLAKVSQLSELVTDSTMYFLSMDDLAINSSALERLLCVTSAGEMQLVTGPPTAELVSWQCKTLLTYGYVSINNMTYYAIARRPCLDQQVLEDSTVHKFGDSVVLASGALEGDVQQCIPIIQEQFLRLQEQLGLGTAVINAGDLMTLPVEGGEISYRS